MALDVFVTALACLTSPRYGIKPTNSSNALPPTTSIIMHNSNEVFQIPDSSSSGSGSGGCPIGALNGIVARINYIQKEVETMKSDLNELQDLLDNFKSESKRPILSTRFLGTEHDVGSALVAPINVTPDDGTARDCWDQPHGQVRIRIESTSEPFYVNCDQKLRDGGWIVIAYRHDGSEDFYRNWHDYKTGFGSLNSEFFIGLDKLHRLTNNRDTELLVVMRAKNKEERFATYDQFSIGNDDEKYLLYVLGAYRGDAGDALRYHAGKKFTTFDQDNDDNGQNCAKAHAGAWWYGRECIESNLFGTFQPQYGQEIGFYKGILWKPFLSGPTGSLHYVRMLIRPRKKT